LAAASFTHEQMMHLKHLVTEECAMIDKCPEHSKTVATTNCVNGFSGEYPCSNVDLLAYVPLTALGTKGDGNDIWGWTDPQTGREYAIMCTVDGTSFVDITDREPLILGFMKTATESSLWRDAKVIGNYALIVSEAKNHGLQVFDLTRLRDLNLISRATKRDNTDPTAVTILTPDAWYKEFGSAHNIFVNEDSATAYVVGAQGLRSCNKVIHMVDVSNPLKPVFAGCLGDKQFTYCHDVQCVTYAGPDTRYTGHEICFGSMGDSIGVMDVTNKKAPVLLNKQTYHNLEFCHQGWLFDGQARFSVNDEIDELVSETSTHTRTIFYDMSDLTAPKHINTFMSPEEASDHNNYVISKNGKEYIFQSNYNAGLRVLRVDDPATASVSEVAYFDVAPLFTGAGFHGTWSNFPYFKSGKVVVSSIERGLFVLQPNLP